MVALGAQCEWVGSGNGIRLSVDLQFGQAGDLDLQLRAGWESKANVVHLEIVHVEIVHMGKVHMGKLHMENLYMSLLQLGRDVV